MRAHPRIIDWIVVLASSGLQRVALIFTGEPINWIAYLALAAAAVALFWRRRYPFAVLLVVTAIASVGLLASPELAYQALPSTFALYAVAASRTTGTAALGYVVAVGLPTLAVLALNLWHSTPFSPSILDPLALLALVLGIAVRARRERRDALAALIHQRTQHAALAERARITAEMHDVVAHSITVMIALAGGARSGWDKHPERARDALDHLNDVGASALGEMQRILRVLRTDDADLDRALHESGHNVQSLEELAEVFRAAGLPVILSRRGQTGIPDPALQTTLHRIVQEALTNALRYAEHPTEVRVEVNSTPTNIEVTITDDGHPHPGRPSVGAGLGLTGIRERAAAFGGTAAAGPRDGGGWRTRVTIPLSEGSGA
ncbi:MAG: histidine kinase [Microbacterium sp.]